MSEATDQLNFSERAFVTRWAETDFSTWNEQTVREEFVIRLLHLLGYGKGTTYDLEMEKELKLTEPYHRIGRKKTAIDYAPSLRLRYFWIVEAKPGTERPMKFGDVLQVHLYAVHPEVQARFIVLCNGWEVRIYDALTLRSFEDALHVCTREDCFTKFSRLQEILGADSLLTFQRRRLISLAKETLDVEVDVQRFRQFSYEMSAMLRGGEEKIRQNARELQSRYFTEWLEAEGDELRKASIEFLFAKMDLPHDARAHAAEEFVKRIVESDQPRRRELVDRLAMQYHGRPHNIFRALAVYVLVRLLEQGIVIEKTNRIQGIPECINELAAANIEYWSGLGGALCHLDNAAMRVAYKFCTRLSMQFMKELLDQGKRAMTAEERVGTQPSVSRLMVPSMAHAQEVLWRKFCSLSSAEEIWAGIWTLQSVETELDKLPRTEYPDGDSDFLFWEYQGVSWDQLRAGTWNALKDKVPLLREAGVAEEVLRFAALSREDLSQNIPGEKSAPGGFVPAWTLAHLARDLLPKILALRATAVIVELQAHKQNL